MELYFSPLACSLAARIALHESGQAAEFHQVTLATKRLQADADYLAVNARGQVPALRTDDGEIVTEVAAVLQYIAERAPDSGLLPPPSTMARTRVQQWLSYVGTELHKAVYYLIFSPAVPAEAKTYARASAGPKYDWLASQLAGREFLVDRFTVADAYLATTLNWAERGGIDLQRWPEIAAYHARMLARPAVSRAMREELALRAAS